MGPRARSLLLILKIDLFNYYVTVYRRRGDEKLVKSLQAKELLRQKQERQDVNTRMGAGGLRQREGRQVGPHSNKC